MVDLNVNSDVVLADDFGEPVAVSPEDYQVLDELRVYNDSLIKYRQEIGRLFQVMNNLRIKADEVEDALATKRRELVQRYNLTLGQWALDFEKKQLVKLDSTAPVIP